MNYKDLLNQYITNSNLSLGEIAKKMTFEKQVKVDRSYLSKLKNGDTRNPASDEINRAIAEVTGGDAENLIKAAYMDKARESINELAEKTGEVDLEELLKPIDHEKDLAELKAKYAEIEFKKSPPPTEMERRLSEIPIEELVGHTLTYKGHILTPAQKQHLQKLLQAAADMLEEK